jgi:hypothetical protein
MRSLTFVVAAIVLLAVAPAFANGAAPTGVQAGLGAGVAFQDVPPDHWAYDAIALLQREGLIIGYPDGTFGGRRAITRYEFAVALARLVGLIPGIPDIPRPGEPGEPPDLGDFVRRGDLPDFTQFATKAEVDALRRLLDEFRDELAALGVDVDALKRDVAALDVRVTQLEMEQRRVKITGDVNVFGVTTNHRSGVVPAFDRDERQILTPDTLGRNISVVRDFDLNVVGRVSATTAAIATINYGNYLNYLVAVDDYIDGPRPSSRDDVQAFSPGLLAHDFVDQFFPYYLYIDAGLGNGQFTVGRFPMQFTPYTFKKIDVDTYTSILKTDSGNYPVDGAKLGYNFGGVDLTLFAVKHNLNDYLVNGLTGQPRAGIYNTGPFVGGLPMHQLNGNSVGGLPGLIAQSAGARAVIGIPWAGNLGLTYYRSWSQELFDVVFPYDQAEVYGADLNIPLFGSIGFGASWTDSKTLARDGAGVGDINDDTTAWDGRFNFGFGKLGLALGYKDIGRNFAAAGFWDKIGRWTNPSNVKGPYGRLSYPIVSNINFIVDSEYLVIKDPTANTGNTLLTSDDRILKAEGGIQWGLSRQNSLALGYEWVRYDPSAPGEEAIETYLTIGWAHQMGSAGLKIGYQFINYNPTDLVGFAYGSEVYRGGLGVVQFGVTF